MCRSIKPLFNFEPASNEEDVRAAALQFVRKISGFTKPSKVNEEVFRVAVDQITDAASLLLRSLQTSAPPKNQAEEAAKIRARRSAD